MWLVTIHAYLFDFNINVYITIPTLWRLPLTRVGDVVIMDEIITDNTLSEGELERINLVRLYL